ncbi:group III truncated hemoglobin [Niabella insulamsoli]|uniref:group III truncated hemoglobin n=1 Tax=Niabella insulamsoli TaxID=3144874 RepID=UPI0031FC2CD9
MKKDITDKADIAFLVQSFYQKATRDEVIGYIFQQAPGFVLEQHLPIMISFWETLLFGVAGYKGNPMLKHVLLHRNIPLKAEHFDRWINLWRETVSSHFEGHVAHEAMNKAASIAKLMQFKIETQL